MKLISLSEKFIIYVTEQTILISLTSLIASIFHIKDAFLGFFLAYKIDFIPGFLHIFDTNYGLYNLLILFLISFCYYSIESLTGHGIAEDIFKLEIINKYEISKNKLLKLLLVRDIIKSFFISNIINSLFILKNKKFLQNEYDNKFNLMLIKNKNENKKSLFLQYFYSSMIMYYSIFFILIIIYTFVQPATPLASSGTVKSGSYNYWHFFSTILKNNITLDVFKYMIGGFSLFTGTFIELFSSNIYEAIIMSSLDITHGSSSFVKYILPQFFPETLGYVFGLSIALVMTDIILSFTQSMIRNEKSQYFTQRTHDLLYSSGFYLILSISLLVIGALIEAGLGIYNF